MAEVQQIAQQTETAKPPKSRVARLVVIVVLLAAIGAGAWWFKARKATAQASEKNTSADSPANPDQQVQSVIHLESFVVNLADPDQNAFLRVGIDLGLGKQLPEGKAPDKNSPLTPQIRDAVLTVLSSCRSDSLLAADGKIKLKEQLLQALHERAQELDVKEVYFTEFLVQR